MLDAPTPAVSAEATAGLRSMVGGTHDTVVCSTEPSEHSGHSNRAIGRGPPIMRCSDAHSHSDGIASCTLPHRVLAVAACSVIMILFLTSGNSLSHARVACATTQTGVLSAFDASGQDDCQFYGTGRGGCAKLRGDSFHIVLKELTLAYFKGAHEKTIQHDPGSPCHNRHAEYPSECTSACTPCSTGRAGQCPG